MPNITGAPELWVLGTSSESAVFAGVNGLPYCFGSFINPMHEFAAIQSYYNHFQPSQYLSEPYLNLAVFALLNKDANEAEKAALSVKKWFIKSFLKKKDVFFPNMDSVDEGSFAFEEKMILDQYLSFAFIGNTEEQIQKLKKKANDYRINELTVVSICEDFEFKKESYLELKNGF
jgi:alkanesulfonate monooxygenase SsuD/methylene tetrahydromethanopterin reductase-like flavin-dependent oxidoreductase (luciferase family)